MWMMEDGYGKLMEKPAQHRGVVGHLDLLGGRLPEGEDENKKACLLIRIISLY